MGKLRLKKNDILFSYLCVVRRVWNEFDLLDPRPPNVEKQVDMGDKDS